MTEIPSRDFSAEQLTEFDRSGFAAWPEYFSAREIAGAGAAIESLASHPPRIGHEMGYFEDKRVAFPPDFERAAGVNYSFKV